MEENKTIEVEVVKKESFLEKVKANSKTIVKRVAVAGAAVAGILIAYSLVKNSNPEDFDDLVVDSDTSEDEGATDKIVESTDETTEE